MGVLAFVRRDLGGRNLVAGIAVAAYLVPQAMAYGALVGVGPSAGLTVALIPLLLYPLLGRSRWLSMGPESTSALMAAATVGPLAKATGLPVVALLATTSVLCGLILLVARLLRAGVVSDLLSKPVLIGYLTGVAVLMAMSQVEKAVGAPVFTDTLPGMIADLADGVAVNPWAVAVAVGVVVVIAVLHRVAPRLPGTLIALALAVVAGFTLPVATIGDFRLALPQPQFAVLPWDVLGQLVVASAAICLVTYTDVLLTARAFAGDQKVNPDRELMSLGAIDVAGGLLGSYPVSASASRTALARLNGATSRWYSWVVAAAVVVAALAFAPLLAHLPQAALAGIIIYAAWLLIDIPGWRSLARLRVGEVLVAAACAAGVVLLGILPGLGVAVGLSIIELLMRLSRPHEAVLGFVPDVPGMHDVDDYPQAETIPGLVVYRYDAPLFFANANDFYSRCVEASESPGCRWLVLNMEANVEVDSTGLDALIELHRDVEARGIHLALARVKNDLLQPMRRYGAAEVIGEDAMYPTLPTAVAAYRGWAARHPAGQAAAGAAPELRRAPRPSRFGRVENRRPPSASPPPEHGS